MFFLFSDIDECCQKQGACHKDARCTNTPGSYVCECSNGYQGDGHTCTGIHTIIRIPHKFEVSPQVDQGSTIFTH